MDIVKGLEDRPSIKMDGLTWVDSGIEVMEW